MFSPEVLSDTVKTSRPTQSPCGISCYFVKLDDNWGIKIYRIEETRNRGAKIQKEMAKHGYGPKVGTLFSVGEKYCYTTEIATTLVDACTKEEDYWKVQQPKLDKMIMENPDIDDKINKLIDKMKIFGFSMYDSHYANFGWLRNELVCIDFAE